MNALAPLPMLALVAWLLLGEPLAGRRAHRRMLDALDAGETAARRRFYWTWTAQGWILAGVTLGVARSNGWGLAQLGLRLPSVSTPASGPSGHFLGGLLAGAGIALAGGLVLGLMLAGRRAPATRPPRVVGSQAVLRMLPRTARERCAFAALALTAGISEELVWRGFGLAALQAAFPALPLAAGVSVLALAFGWAHFYQGIAGMLATTAIGALLAWLYVATGSLLPPMLLHALIDLRLLLIREPDAPAGPPAREP